MDVDLTPLSEPDEETLSPVGISAELVFPGTLTDPGSLSVTTPDHLLSEHILGSIPLWEAKGRPTGAKRASYQKQIYRDVWRNGRLCKVSLASSLEQGNRFSYLSNGGVAGASQCGWLCGR